jgi:hypothetical protein
MALTKQRQREKKARDLILKALAEYHGEEPDAPKFREKCVTAQKYHIELTKDGIDEGILCMLLLNNMSTALAGYNTFVNLYQLLHNYLLDPSVRDQINDVLFSTLEQSIRK